MALFTDTITVYNSIGDSEWKRTVVHGVQWTDKEETVTSEKNAKVRKSVKDISIDFSRNYGNTDEYVDPKKFEKLGNKDGYWTLNAESGLDVVVLGECSMELNGSYRIKHLRTDVECATVKSVSDYRNRSFLKHIKAVAE